MERQKAPGFLMGGGMPPQQHTLREKFLQLSHHPSNPNSQPVKVPQFYPPTRNLLVQPPYELGMPAIAPMAPFVPFVNHQVAVHQMPPGPHVVPPSMFSANPPIGINPFPHLVGQPNINVQYSGSPFPPIEHPPNIMMPNAAMYYPKREISKGQSKKSSRAEEDEEYRPERDSKLSFNQRWQMMKRRQLDEREEREGPVRRTHTRLVVPEDDSDLYSQRKRKRAFYSARMEYGIGGRRKRRKVRNNGGKPTNYGLQGATGPEFIDDEDDVDFRLVEDEEEEEDNYFDEDLYSRQSQSVARKMKKKIKKERKPRKKRRKNTNNAQSSSEVGSRKIIRKDTTTISLDPIEEARRDSVSVLVHTANFIDLARDYLIGDLHNRIQRFETRKGKSPGLPAGSDGSIKKVKRSTVEKIFNKEPVASVVSNSLGNCLQSMCTAPEGRGMEEIIKPAMRITTRRRKKNVYYGSDSELNKSDEDRKRDHVSEWLEKRLRRGVGVDTFECISVMDDINKYHVGNLKKKKMPLQKRRSVTKKYMDNQESENEVGKFKSVINMGEVVLGELADDYFNQLEIDLEDPEKTKDDANLKFIRCQKSAVGGKVEKDDDGYWMSLPRFKLVDNTWRLGRDERDEDILKIFSDKRGRFAKPDAISDEDFSRLKKINERRYD